MGWLVSVYVLCVTRKTNTEYANGLLPPTSYFRSGHGFGRALNPATVDRLENECLGLRTDNAQPPQPAEEKDAVNRIGLGTACSLGERAKAHREEGRHHARGSGSYPAEAGRRNTLGFGRTMGRSNDRTRGGFTLCPYRADPKVFNILNTLTLDARYVASSCRSKAINPCSNKVKLLPRSQIHRSSEGYPKPAHNMKKAWHIAHWPKSSSQGGKRTIGCNGREGPNHLQRRALRMPKKDESLGVYLMP